MIRRTSAPRVHGLWTGPWYDGHPELTALFGSAPSEQSLQTRAHELPARSGWESLVHRAQETPIPSGALVVLAGQQPVLGGGAGLVAHKAATAVALAQHLTASLERPVVPVFLLATQDHDSDEVDHLDLIDESTGCLQRVRCPIEPKHDMFSRSRWPLGGLAAAFESIASLNNTYTSLERILKVLLEDGHVRELSWHVAELLHATFAEQGLRILEAHRLEPWGREILARAMTEPGPTHAALAGGATSLQAQGMAVSFDPEDPRPLVLESTAGRRRRLTPRDDTAAARQRANPDDFSPHAALRPIVQAAALPVVAQVAGPSEIIYLGQARGLHAVFDQVPPVLVPRLEATRVPDDLWQLAEEAPAAGGPAAVAALQLGQAGHQFRDSVTALDPSLRPKLDRFVERLERQARRLAEAPAWRGHGDRSRAAVLRPRGRLQDTTLAWIPDAWSCGRPAEWASHIVGLSRPLLPPTHVLHSLPEPSNG